MNGDDTRDIAIRADESGKSAHKRLDTINGQIRRVGDEVAGVREKVEELRNDTTDGFAAMVEDASAKSLAQLERISAVDVKVERLGEKVSSALKVAGAIVGAVLAVCTGLTVYAIEHSHHLTPPQAVQQGK